MFVIFMLYSLYQYEDWIAKQAIYLFHLRVVSFLH